MLNLTTAPWWVLSLVQALLVGSVAVPVGAWIDPDKDRGLLSLLVHGLIAAIPLGLVFGLFQARQNRQTLADTGLPEPAAQAAARAAARGPVPADPQVRAAARTLASNRLSALEGQRTAVLLICAAAFVASVVGAAVSFPGLILTAVVFAAALAGAVFLPGHLERRIDDLTDLPDSPRVDDRA